MTVAPSTRPDLPDLEEELRLLSPLPPLFDSVGTTVVDRPPPLRLEPAVDIELTVVAPIRR
jgi:hypothetical protein